MLTSPLSTAEVTLATFPGSTENERAVLVLHPATASDAAFHELRQESWDKNIGWYTQQSVRLESQQVAGLRTFLGGHLAGASLGASGSPGRNSSREFRARSTTLRVIRADSA